MTESSNFKEKLTYNKRVALNKLIQDMNKEKLRVLQAYLDESNISYDKSINDYHKLIAYLKKNLSKEQREQVLDKCKEIDDTFQNLIDELSKGSTTAFNRFLKKLSTIVKPISIGLALNTAIRIAPDPVTKLIPMAISVLYSTYKICKNHKYKKIINKGTKLNQKLQEMELKYDSNGKLIDTRFTPEEQALIRAKLKEMHVDFVDTGYQSLRTVIYNLDYEKKLQLVMALEGKTNRHDFEKELRKYNDLSIFEKRKFFPVATSITSGALTTLGVLDVTKLLGLAGLNGFLATNVAEMFTDNKALSGIAGYFASVGTVLGTESPIIQAESLFIGAVIGETLRLFAKTVRSVKRTFSNKKLSKQYVAIEQEKYKQDDLREQQLLEQHISTSQVSQRIGEAAIIEIITEYIERNLKIKINTRPKNIQQLGLIISKLSSGDQNKIHNLMEEFKHFNTHRNNQIFRKLEKFLKATGMTALYGLAGMSVIDIFTRGEFLNQVSQKLFPYAVAPEPIIVVEEHPQIVTNDPGAGLVRRNEGGEHILETVYTIETNEAFNTHCNYCTDPAWLMEDTGLTVEQYMGNYSLETYIKYNEVADVLITHLDREEDIAQVQLFKEFLEKMIAKRQFTQQLSEAGTVAGSLSAGSGLIEGRTENKASRPKR